MDEIVVVPLSYLQHYHQESLQNPQYSTDFKQHKQREILTKLKKKGGVGEDEEVALKKSDLRYFQLA